MHNNNASGYEESINASLTSAVTHVLLVRCLQG